MKKRRKNRTSPARAEVLVLGPADPNDMTFHKLVDMLVEYGIYFESDTRDRLPIKFPKDWSRYKAVIVDADLPFAGKVAAAAQGKRVIYRKPAEFSWHDERPLWICLSALLMNFAVTKQNPAFLGRNAHRRDRDVILGQAEACLREEPGWCRRWCDSSLVRLEGIWAAARHYGRYDLKRQVLRCIDDAIKAYKDAPVYGKGENKTGLFKHPIYPGLLLPIWKETGLTRFRDAALDSMETLEEARRIAREWREGTPFLQCESLDRKPWQWAMRARWCDEPGFFQPAVDCMKAGYETLFDPAKKLWAHAGVRDQRKGLAWGRGQGWALYGLVGLLEHLPKDHPEFDTMRAWLDLTAEGLRRTQDPATGLWHNVMDEPATRLETSGTAKCIRHFSRAWRLGLCRKKFVPGMLARGWFGLKAHTFNHRSCTRCYGTGPGYDMPFYASLAAGSNYTAAVQAGAEYVATFGPQVD